MNHQSFRHNVILHLCHLNSTGSHKCRLNTSPQSVMQERNVTVNSMIYEHLQNLTAWKTAGQHGILCWLRGGGKAGTWPNPTIQQIPCHQWSFPNLKTCPGPTSLKRRTEREREKGEIQAMLLTPETSHLHNAVRRHQEYIVQSKITAHLDKHGIITDPKHVYCKKRSPKPSYSSLLTTYCVIAILYHYDTKEDT